MPPPTEKCVHPAPDVPSTVNVRMATARSAVTRSGSPADVSIHPSAPQ